LTHLFYFENKKTERLLDDYISLRKDISAKLERLRINPRYALGAHRLGGAFEGNGVVG